jgi:hypothetical protein
VTVLVPFIEPMFTLFHMFGVLFFCHSPSVMNERLLCVDNGQSEVSSVLQETSLSSNLVKASVL